MAWFTPCERRQFSMIWFLFSPCHLSFVMYILHCIAIFLGAAQTLQELENSNKSSNRDLSYSADQCTVRVFGEDPILSTKEGFGGDIVKREPANETHDISVVKLTNTPLFHPEFSQILRSTSTCPLWERSHLPPFFSPALLISMMTFPAFCQGYAGIRFGGICLFPR